MLANLSLYLMLQNRIYRGEVAHQGAAYPGQHEAIVDLALWRIVQEKLITNRHARALSAGAEAPSLLAGLIFDADGDRMTLRAPRPSIWTRAVSMRPCAKHLNSPSDGSPYLPLS